MNTIANVHQLLDTPSRQDGIPAGLERDLRIMGCELVQVAGILLRLPQTAIATAQVLLHRFYCVASLLDHGVMKTAQGAIFLAAKLTEEPRGIKHVCNVVDYLVKRKRVPRGSPVEPIELYSNAYYEGRKSVVAVEMLILHALGFQVHVQHPHGVLMCYINQLGLSDRSDVTRQAWGYLNDSLRTDVCVCYQPHTIACAVLFMAAKDFRVSLQTVPPWYSVLDTSLEEIQNIAGKLLELYNSPPPPKLPMTTAELRVHLSDHN